VQEHYAATDAREIVASSVPVEPTSAAIRRDLVPLPGYRDASVGMPSSVRCLWCLLGVPSCETRDDMEPELLSLTTRQSLPKRRGGGAVDISPL